MMLSLRYAAAILIVATGISFLVLQGHLHQEGGSMNGKQDFDVAKELGAIRQESPNIFEGIHARLEDILERGGVSGMIAVIQKAFSERRISLLDCHNLLHSGGHLAYSRYSNNLPELLQYENSLCVFALQHGIEAQIVETHSLRESIPILRKHCALLYSQDRTEACYHGAGHAWMHITLDPKKALRNCDLLVAGGAVQDLWICRDGVFHDYVEAARGIDAESGLLIKGGPLIRVDWERPWEFCETLETRHRGACYQKIVKVLGILGGTDALRRCAQSVYPEQVQDACALLQGSISLDDLFSGRVTTYILPSFASSPVNFRKAYLSGLGSSLHQYDISGAGFDTRAFCAALTEEDRQSLPSCT